jgi:hypothetical protein
MRSCLEEHKLIYLTKINAAGEAVYFLWGAEIEGGEDVFYLNAEGLDFACAATLREIIAIAEAKSSESNLLSSEPPTQYDFDLFWRRLSQVNVYRYSNSLICRYLLDGWNYLEDFTLPIGVDLMVLQSAQSKSFTDQVYQKLFWGSNLPAFTPDGRAYHPIWSALELHAARQYLRTIWAKLRNKSNTFNELTEGVTIPSIRFLANS